MYGNIHTLLKFQYTALETRKYGQLKTTETDKGNYLSHDKRVIVVPPLHKCKIFYFSVEPHSKEVSNKSIGSNDPWFFSGKSLLDSDRTTLLFDIKSSLFSLEQTEGDILPNGRKNSSDYVTQTTKMQDFVLTVQLLVHILIGMKFSLDQDLGNRKIPQL